MYITIYKKTHSKTCTVAGVIKKRWALRGIGLIHDKRNNEGSQILFTCEFFLSLF